MIEIDKNVMANKMAECLNKAYSKIPSVLQDGRKPQLRWPSGISWEKDNDIIKLYIGKEAIKKNMQTDENAFESWILAMVALGQYDPFFHCNYSVEFDKLDVPHAEAGDEERVEWQHYQRFLFRINLFFELFGSQWFSLKEEYLKLAASSEYYEYRSLNKLQCNTGGKGRNVPPDMSVKKSGLTESQLEWLLSKHSESDRFKNSIPHAFKFEHGKDEHGKVYRQFPIGIFKNKVSKDKISSLFPSGKACIDLVANGNDSSFWIFELKKKGNKALGIVSELLFYSAVVSDMITGKIEGSKANDEHCYKPEQLRDKKAINACFLAPDFHPLFLNDIIDILNKAFAVRNKSVPVIFHKAVIDITSGNINILNG